VCAACLLEVGMTDGSAVVPLHPDRLLDYLRLINVIGEGPRGRVFLAEWTTPDGGVAALKYAKSPTGGAGAGNTDLQRLLRLDHPAIATLFEAGTGADLRWYAITEFVPGQPITRFSDREQLSVTARVALLLQATDAVYYAHSLGIPHLNLKPSNLLAARGAVKVLDFEAAMPAPRSRSPYQPPEQIAGERVDLRSDIFALGVMLGELMAARADASIAEVVRRATMDDPSRRYPTVAEFAAALSEAAGRWP
jgi:serine/threonine protein kinase